jgi:hypothetical protein
VGEGFVEYSFGLCGEFVAYHQKNNPTDEVNQSVSEGSAPLRSTCEKEKVVGEGGECGESSTKSDGEKKA